MTREEIKDIVRHVFHFYEVNAENCNWTDMNEACGEIFKALEQEPFINKPCVSSGVCEHDKNKVLDKIRAEINTMPYVHTLITREIYVNRDKVINILDKYKGESEEK